MAPRRSWTNASNRFRSAHIAAWYRCALEAEDDCRRRDLSTATLMLWARHLLSPEDLRKRKEHLRNLRRKAPEQQCKKARSKRRWRPPRYRYSVRTDSGPIAPLSLEHVCRSDELQRHGACRVCRCARSFASCVAHMARSPRRIRRRNGLALAASSECPGSIKQRC
jgi:hypothetical protein